MDITKIKEIFKIRKIKDWLRIYGIQIEDTKGMFWLDVECSERYFKKVLEPHFYEHFYTNYRQKILKAK